MFDDTHLPRTMPGTIDRSSPRVKALAVILDAECRSHAVLRAVNQAGGHFNRPLGGGVELGERAAEAVVREIREELEADLVGVRPLDVLENIFTLDGEVGHEVCFVFVGSVADGVVPPGGRPFVDNDSHGWVEWRPVRDADAGVPLYPAGLQELIEAHLVAASPDGAA